MNVAHTVSSDIDAVDFTFLSPKEILAISAKRIENESTFDSLLNPVHGGLYDPALGSWGDELCATCNLNQTGCPGHPGHIQLSVPVYHPIFMDQTYLLLRAACVYCRGFRIPTKDIHKYKCKLRLLQFGLVHEAHGVDGVGESDLVDDTSSEADEEGASNDNAITKREKYVRQCLRGLNHRRQRSKDEHEGVAQDRREVIKSFLAEVTKSRQCSTCSGISPSYRKDRFVKIFEKSLSPKEQAKMAQKNLLHQDAMARSRHEQSKDRVEAESLSESTSINESYSDREVNVGPATSQRYISAMEVRARLNDLFQKEQDIVSLLYNKKARTQRTPAVSADMFFITTILVPPNRYRPEARMGANQVTEAEQNTLYKNILRSCTKIAHVHAGLSTNERSDMAQLHQACTELQEVVNALIDKNQNPVQGAAANRNGDGIKQKLEKKEGLFRKNMMGKRVNFAARSVISPDPNIETNEIGVPLVFATKLTFPEPVTSYNFKHMQQAVINGTDRWPGASAIEDENGRVQQLRNKTVDERISLANQLLAPTDFKAPRMRNKKVHRHMTNGDVVLMNRQPTLHKASVMGHRVRVLPGEKTIRMHYANCNAYNADFDGDEMNMHFPQNEIARAEALQIADTDHQYLSTTQGKPLRGLIQDHISVSIALCSRDALFSRGDYHALVYSAIRPESDYNLRQRIELVPPAIIKPVPRWSGKQVITTILKNIQPPGCGPLTLLGESQIKAQQWGLKSEEGTVHIQEGEFVTGILDKAQIGQSSGGLIHAAYEAYGPAVAGKLLTALGRLLTRYLQMRAFSCGMDDLRLSVKGETSRREELQATERVGYEIASNYVSIDPHSRPNDALLLERLEEVIRDDKKHEGLDLLMSQGAARITDAIQKACIPDALQKPFPQNQMQAMTTSGAKGSRVNASLISCNLGQQVLEGRRVPIMVSGKSLPCYKPFETNISANGFIGSRFLTGIRPQEYFFHHMAGREGLIDTAVKTSRSGYLQRCVIKGLEGLTVGYDSAVRDSDGSVIQFLYGEDGLDVTKQTYLKDFGFILRNLMSEASQLQFDPEVAKRVAANRSTFTKYMKSALKHSQRGDPKGKDPLSSAFNPATNAFVFSESFYDAMTSYLQHDAKGLVREKSNTSAPTPSVLLSRKNAELLFAMKYLRALAEPGEAVGIVAGQSIGEPSTQMTLNTFHLAGHAAKNVTAGIPRLREILMTASKDISTPTMSLYPRQQLSKDKVDAFVTLINALPLSHTLDCVNVEEKVGRGERYGLAKMYTVRLRFFPSKDYTDAYKIGISEVLDTVAKTLVRQIVTLSKAEIKKRATQEAMPTTDIGMSAGVVEFAAPTTSAGVRAQDDDDDDEEGNDENYSTAKQQNSRYEAVSYEPDDDADNEVQQAMVAIDDSEADDVDTVGDLVSDEVSEAEISDRENRQKSKPRAEHVLETFQEVTHFDCDERSGEWCSLTLEFDASVPKLLMLDIVERAIKRTFVREIRGLGACKIVEEPSGKKELAVHVTGVNFKAVQQLGDYIDPDRIQSNDIAAILSAYGVEACRANIVKELGDVFGSHGIKVDYRHLSLIGDHMTRNGGFTAFSRIGLRGNVSPFTKMSFETTLAFLKDAVLDGDWDGLTTPSGRLVMGQLGKLGTGSFDVLTTLPTHVDTLA